MGGGLVPSRRGPHFRRGIGCILLLGSLSISSCGVDGGAGAGASQEVRVGDPPSGGSSTASAPPADDSPRSDQGSQDRGNPQGPALAPAPPQGPAHAPVPPQAPPLPAQPAPPVPAQPGTRLAPPPGPPTSSAGTRVTARVVLSGSRGLALRTAPSTSSEVLRRAADGTTLFVDCALPGELVSEGAPRFQGTSVWVRTADETYATLLYLQVDGDTTLPDCRPGQPAVPLVVTSAR
jgi:hypothetical protein